MKSKKIRIKKPTTCWCFYGWVCEDHPDQPWGDDGCGAAGELCTNPQCDKDPDSIFLSVQCSGTARKKKTASQKNSVTKWVRFTQPWQRLTLGPPLLDGISKGTHNMRLMDLRAHPLMTYWGLPNWPPTWMWIDGNVNKNPKGEVGTLVEVQVCQSQRANRFFLVIEYEDSQYMGCLQFDDLSFRRRVCDLLGKYCGHSIQEIGSIDLSIS